MTDVTVVTLADVTESVMMWQTVAENSSEKAVYLIYLHWHVRFA